MDNVIKVLISVFRLDKGNEKKKYGYFAGILSITINLLIFIFKLLFGLFLNSLSLIADAVHSLSDIMTSGIVILGFNLSAKPADQRHPFGHGRAEVIVSLIIACILIAVGFEFLVQGIQRIQQPVPIGFHWLVVIGLFVSILLKEITARISFKLGERINARSLKADAWHHRTDAISTLLVIIGFVLYRYGLYYVDGILGILIALFIGYTGIRIIKESGSALIGEAPSPAFINRLKMIVLQCQGVSDVHHIHVHDYSGQIEITVHIRLRPDLSLGKAHEKTLEVEDCIKKEIPSAEVTVHPEPETDNG